MLGIELDLGVTEWCRSIGFSFLITNKLSPQWRFQLHISVEESNQLILTTRLQYK